MPIVPLPGRGAIILTLIADNLKARSSSRFLILDILIPILGIISYKVNVGPIEKLIFSIVIL